MKEEQSKQRDSGAGAKVLWQVGETAGRPVCLERWVGGGEGQRELTHLIKVSNEELCILLNYSLSPLGDGLKWKFHVFPRSAYGEPAGPSGLR